MDEEQVGDYPFDAYGSLVLDVTLGFALETQTLSLYDKPWFDGTYGGRGVWEPFLNDWVYGTKTPPMPGHPDWTVTPAGATARTLTAPPELPFHRR